MPSDELKRQWQFAYSAAYLIIRAVNNGYKVTLGEALRTPEQAALNAKSGSGIANSLHCEKLAIDINLFMPDGTYITDDRGHKDLGAWWKTNGPNYKWGGDFEKKDFNHYSISPDGIRG